MWASVLFFLFVCLWLQKKRRSFKNEEANVSWHWMLLEIAQYIWILESIYFPSLLCSSNYRTHCTILRVLRSSNKIEAMNSFKFVFRRCCCCCRRRAYSTHFCIQITNYLLVEAWKDNLIFILQRIVNDKCVEEKESNALDVTQISWNCFIFALIQLLWLEDSIELNWIDFNTITLEWSAKQFPTTFWQG